MDIRDVIVAPIITEKSMQDAAKGRFTFRVAKDADKSIIKRAVEEKFKVEVLRTFVSVVKGKRGRVGIKRVEINVQAWKKATVKLAKDQKISLFDAGGKTE